MVFSSTQFIFVFLPIALVAYYIVPKKLQNFALMFASLVFYAWGGVEYTAIILSSILGNFLFGLVIARFKGNKALCRALLIASVAFNLLLLGYFKYYNFIADNVNVLFSGELLTVRNVALPIGISFYTFQAMSYVIDVYRDDVRVQKNVINFAMYISMFPQLIAGPIVRYRDIEDQMYRRTVSVDDLCYGIKRFVFGLSKKVLIANYLGLVSDRIFSVNAAYLSTGILWAGYVSYAFQIYYDFSGYSDMAIGLGRILGFDFIENFDYPYLSRSITEFWRRWHISLSSWFREYVYIPLGGNRKGGGRTALNLLIVFVLTGLWHGANWQFLCFGLWHGLCILFERFVLKGKIERMRCKPVSTLLTFISAVIGWVFFRSDNVAYAAQSLKSMIIPTAGNSAYNILQFFDIKSVVVLCFAVVLCGPLQTLVPKLRDKLFCKDEMKLPMMLLLLALFFCSIAKIIAGSYNPFIYFQF